MRLFIVVSVALVLLAVLCGVAELRSRRDKLTNLPLIVTVIEPTALPSQLLPSPAAYGRITPSEPVGMDITLPEGMKAPRYCLLVLPCSGRGLLCVLSGPPGETTSLWADLDRDGRFTASERFDAKRMEEGAGLFGPMEMVVDNEGGKVAAYLVNWYDTLVARSATTSEGSLTVGGKKYRFALCDDNLDGRITATMPPGNTTAAFEPFAPDALLLDVNGDGEFDRGEDAASSLFERRPLAGLIQLPDGEFYTVACAEDGKSASFARDRSPRATLRSPCEHSTLILANRTGYLIAGFDEKEFRIPAGEYSLRYVSLGFEDERGECWTLVVYPDIGGEAPFRLAKGESKALDCGPPLKLSLETDLHAGQRFISLVLNDRTGGSVGGLTMPNGKEPDPPELRITDAAGKVVKSEKFHYG